MLLRLRLWVADRPGALGQATREIGACGADIVQISVLSRERGRALDEITVFLPDDRVRERLERSLRSLDSLSLEGVRACGEVPGAFPDLDLLGRVAADPRAALELLADALPRILAADWAVIARPGSTTPLARSWDAPREPLLPQLPDTAAAVSIGESRYATAPVGERGVHAVVCRVGDPVFHRFEVMRLARLTEVSAAIAGSRMIVARPVGGSGSGSGGGGSTATAAQAASGAPVTAALSAAATATATAATAAAAGASAAAPDPVS